MYWHVLKPVRRQSLSDAVFEQLRDRILGGEVASGTSLPPERELAKQLGVNRQAVREALKRLEQMRLVSIQHGGGTTVVDYRSEGYLDLLPPLAFVGAQLDRHVLRSIAELRAAVYPEIARLAALRATGRLRSSIADRVEAMGESVDLFLLHDQVQRFWTLLAEGSQNVAFRLMFNNIRMARAPFLEGHMASLEAELTDRDSYFRIAQAVGTGDTEGAARYARVLVEKGERGLAEALHPVEPVRRGSAHA